MKCEIKSSNNTLFVEVKKKDYKKQTKNKNILDYYC